MNRNQILVGALILMLSWALVVAVTFAVTREFSDYDPPFGDYDFGACLNDQNSSEWCNAYFTALQDVWDFQNETQGVGTGAAAAVEPSNEKVILVVVDKFSEGTVVYEAEPLPSGECPHQSPSMETVVHVKAGEGPSGVSMSMNEKCEIVIDEIR